VLTVVWSTFGVSVAVSLIVLRFYFRINYLVRFNLCVFKLLFKDGAPLGWPAALV